MERAGDKKDSKMFFIVSVVAVAAVGALWLKFFGVMANLPSPQTAAAQDAPSVDAARGSQALMAAMKNAASFLFAPSEVKFQRK
jgi:hypothetical protein